MRTQTLAQRPHKKILLQRTIQHDSIIDNSLKFIDPHPAKRTERVKARRKQVERGEAVYVPPALQVEVQGEEDGFEMQALPKGGSNSKVTGALAEQIAEALIFEDKDMKKWERRKTTNKRRTIFANAKNKLAAFQTQTVAGKSLHQQLTSLMFSARLRLSFHHAFRV